MTTTVATAEFTIATLRGLIARAEQAIATRGMVDSDKVVLAFDLSISADEPIVGFTTEDELGEYFASTEQTVIVLD